MTYTYDGKVLVMNEKILVPVKVYIVGAHSRAQTLAVYLQYLYPEVSIEAFLFDNNEKNPKEIKGTPVIRLNGNAGLITDYPVFIATRGIYHEPFMKKLIQIGFSKILPVTYDMDLKLRNAYLKNYFASVGREFKKIEKLDSKRNQDAPAENLSGIVYVAKSAFDNPLRQSYKLKFYEKEIQVGAELTEKRVSPGVLTDNIGDNISDKNQQFCELTALYWIWKHAEEDYIGLVHYRRHFIMPDDWMERMYDNGIDVILPVPLYVAPSLEENYKNRHDPSDWDFMMRYLKEKNEQEYQIAEKFFDKSNLYSPCNMFLMRKTVLDKLCGWLFPILFAVADHGGQKHDQYLNRYPGFISERMITFFFEKNRESFQIAYSDKNFLF